MNPEPFNPYAASVATEVPLDVPAQGLPTGPYGPYRDNRTLAKWVIALLFMGIAMHIAWAIVNLNYTLLPDAVDAGLLEKIEGGLSIASYSHYACYIVFGVWIVRSAKNAWLFAGWQNISAKQPTDTPGWALGWYFIPIANFWKPYVAMRQIVDASTVRVGLSSFLLPTWWTLWIVSSFADSFTNGVAKQAENWNAALVAVIWTSASAIHIAVHVIAISLVRAVTALQTTATRELADEKEAAPHLGGGMAIEASADS